MGDLSTPESVQRLRTALHAKAKDEPGFRFYTLYDKIHRPDVLEHAYACCRANKRAAGVDGLTFEAVEAHERERWIGDLAQQLREDSYRPEAVRRVYIPKPNGKQRPLGIPRLADRVCQMAAMLVLEPIFEADMPSEQYAYRQNRSAQDTTLAYASRGTQEQLATLKTRMGWQHIPWYTITGDFDKDFGVDQWHGHNVFLRDENDKIFRTYLINGRGDEAMGTVWSYLDATPLGRHEDWEVSPEDYPQTSRYKWWHWHDAYGNEDRKWANVVDDAVVTLNL